MIDKELRETIRDVHDFPKKGIVFKDITPILLRPDLIDEIISEFKSLLVDINIDAVACVESRGFWFGTILAHELKLPIIPIRKRGKLPHKTVSVSYDLEYGSEVIEAHEDAIVKGHKILIHDDLLATGGTAEATARLIEQSGGEVAAFTFLVNLTFLNGLGKLQPYKKPVISILDY